MRVCWELKLNEVAFCMRTVLVGCMLVYLWRRWVFMEGEPVLGCLLPVSLPVISFFCELKTAAAPCLL